MTTPWQTFPVSFTGGLISNMGQLQQGINAVGSATTLQNFEPSKEGGYKKILGFTKYIDDEVTGTGPILGVKIVSSTLAIAARQNASVTEYYKSDGSVWTSLGSAASLGGKLRAVEFNYDGTLRIMFVDGTNSPALYDSSTGLLTFPAGLPTDVVGGQNIVSFKGSIFISKGSNIAFTAPFTYSDFSIANGAGVINVGDTVIGMIVFREQLIIFTKTSIKRLVGNTSADYQLQPITEDIGCIAADTIQEVGGDIMFMAQDGLRLLSATERIGDFGLNIASTPITKDTAAFISTANTFTSFVIRNKAQYRVFSYKSGVAASASEGLLATKFSDQGAESIAWAKLRGIRAHCSASRYVGNVEQILFGNDDGYVYELESGSSFDGESIEAIYESPAMPIEDPRVRKGIYKMTLYTSLTGVFSVDVNFRFDRFNIDVAGTKIVPITIRLSNSNSGVFTFGGATAIFGTATFGAELDQVYTTPVIGSGNTFSFRIQDNSTNPSFSLDTAVFEYRNFDRK